MAVVNTSDESLFVYASKGFTCMVIPAKAGIQNLDSRLHGNDGRKEYTEQIGAE